MIAMTNPQERSQSRLFPLGTCGCGHAIPVIKDREPCPDCMQAYDPHDCPLVANPTQHEARAA
jgi:hypothetical protein